MGFKKKMIKKSNTSHKDTKYHKDTKILYPLSLQFEKIVKK